ncbi:DUF5655 domain-containing protein [Flavihumibacter fluvii]|uniref:DUF5655 domain-containing protein n=1 Tax=Flavihumibacter fluvii TaxID=2838157 RepID=UPI001EFA788D|nr:DUF5655 domain-containing protein [Flavihumibacter fluvii]ULQ54633.1 DUF5655 domain-containing protein [Flavihumibacter fluvii]
MHSCKIYPLDLHFKGKPKGELLYNSFKKAVKNTVGNFWIESLECCIHFVSPFAFAAIKIGTDKIIVDFSLNRKLESCRIIKNVQMSANRFLYMVELKNNEEINLELLEWIREAREKTIPKDH